MMQVAIFWKVQRGPAQYTRRSAMHLSKLDIGGADAGAGGMSISSGSGGADASGIGASSSSSDASPMLHSTGCSGAGSGSICFANKSPVACSSLAFATASRKSSSLDTQAMPPSCPHLAGRDRHSCRPPRSRDHPARGSSRWTPSA